MKKICISIILILTVVSLSALNVAAVIQSTPDPKYPQVTTPDMLFLYNEIPYDDRGIYSVNGIYFQHQVGQPIQYITNSATVTNTNTNGIGLKPTDIPSQFQSKIYDLGWYNYGTDKLGQFVSGGIDMQNRDYYQIGFAFSFRDFPLYHGYTVFEIVLNAFDCYWVNDTLDPSSTDRQQLRFDSGDGQYMGLGYFEGNYFRLVSSNKVERVGDKWLKLTMTVPNNRLREITAFQMSLNATSINGGSLETDSKYGTLYLNFYFSSLINYAPGMGVDYPDYAYANGLIYEVPENIPNYDYKDPADLVDEQDKIDFFDSFADFIKDYINGQLSNDVGFWGSIIIFFSNQSVFSVLIAASLFFIIIKALIGR